MLKNLIFKLLIKWGWLNKTTDIWVLGYTLEDEKLQIETFLSEILVVRRRDELWDKNPNGAFVIQEYTGVDTTSPLTVVKKPTTPGNTYAPQSRIERIKTR